MYAMERAGKWSKAQTIHQDTTAGLSHSFGKIIPLANGEVGALWLDVKVGPNGRTLVYATTKPSQGFGEMRILDEQTCECCRIDAIASENGEMALVYRDLNDKGERDMGFIRSSDFGMTFSKPATLYEDHWKVNACPHAGPSLATSNQGLQAAYYTGAESGNGIKWIQVGNKQILLHLKGEQYRMPQLGTNSEAKTALVYAEITQEGEQFFKQIKMAQQNNSKITTILLSQKGVDCSYPVIIGNQKGYLIAYQMERKIVVQTFP
jgi:hypothetical protein